VPPHVFWVRRAVALGVVGGLVWAVIGLVGVLDLSMHDGDPARATTTGAETEAEDGETAEEDEERATRKERKERKERKAARLARRAAKAADPGQSPGKPMPTGPCADSDVVVTPTVPDGHAGGPVEVVLELTTLKSEACEWQVDPDSVFVTITKGTTTLWSSQHCPRAITATSAVPRQDTPDRVSFDWSGKESQPGCTVETDWVWPGTYTINAVARGSVKAVEASFALGHPEASAAPAPKRSQADDPRAERRQARREARAAEQAEEEDRRQAEREQARRDALQQARETKREERRQERRERRERRESGSGDR
jgi:hypothetical protein